MRPIIPGLVAALLLASACTPKPHEPVRDPSITYGIPTPSHSPGPSTPSPTTTPSKSATPSTEDLVRQTQAAYKVAFDEFERLSWAGGADEPSPRMQQVATGSYLEQDVSLLREQKRRGFRLEGEQSTTRSRPAPGRASAHSDPLLTIQVCEDRREAILVERDGHRVPGRLSQGYVFATHSAGRLVLVDIETNAVERCHW